MEAKREEGDKMERGKLLKNRFWMVCTVSIVSGMGIVGTSYAQIPPDQLNHWAAIQDQHDQAIRAQQQAAIAAQAAAYHEKQIAAERAARARKAKEAEEAAEKAKADAIAEQERAEERAKEDAIEKFKMEQALHQENYQEKLRDLDIQQREYALKRDEARAHHAEDFVGLELKKEALEVGDTASVAPSSSEQVGSESSNQNLVANKSQTQSDLPQKGVCHWYQLWCNWWR